MLVRDPVDSDIRLLVWAALESGDPERLFGVSSGLTALAPMIRAHAERAGREVADVDVRVATALAAMVATAFRVLGPVARIAGGVGPDEADRFDDATVELIRRIVALTPGEPVRAGDGEASRGRPSGRAR